MRKEREEFRYYFLDLDGTNDRRPSVADLFHNAGFSKEHTSWIDFLDYREKARLMEEMFDPEIAKHVSRIFPYGQIRNLIFRNPERDSSGEFPGRENMLVELARALKSQKTEEARSEFVKDMSEVVRSEIGRQKGLEFIDMELCCFAISAAARIVGNPPIYALFGRESSRVAPHITEQLTRDKSLSRLNDQIHFFESREGQMFLESMKPPDETVIFINRYTLEEALGRKDLQPIVLEHLHSARNWADSIASLDRAFCSVGLGYFKREAIDQALIRNYVQIEALKLFAAKRPSLRGKTLQYAYDKLEKTLQAEEKMHQRPETEAFRSDQKRISSAIETVSPAERYALLCFLYQQLGEDGVGKILAELTSDPAEFKIATDKKITWLAEAVERSRRTEHPRNPLITRGLVIKNGYEVEMKHLTNTQRAQLGGDDFFSTARLLGFNRGRDHFEASPGPFYDPRTGTAIFEMLLDTGLGNLYLESRWTFHFNINLEKDEDFLAIAWAFFVAGTVDDYARPKNSYECSRNLYIYSKGQDYGVGRYKEGKFFRIMTRDQFFWTYQCATHIASAAQVYRNLCSQNSVENLTFRGLNTCRGGKTEKTIARRWLHFRQKMKCGLDSCGFSSFAEGRSEVGGGQMKLLHGQQALVFPGIASRHNPMPTTVEAKSVKLYCESSKVVHPIAVKMDGKTWPTVLHFAQDAINETVKGILEDMGDFETLVEKRIEQIDQSTGKTRRTLIDALFAEIKADVPNQASWKQKEVIYAEIRGIYVTE